MNPDTAPKHVSKSALHRKRSCSGDRINSASVITDYYPTVSLSLSFSNLGDFAPQGHLDTKTKANDHNKKVISLIMTVRALITNIPEMLPTPTV